MSKEKGINKKLKKVLFDTFALVWGGGIGFSLLLYFADHSLGKISIIIVIAAITTGFYRFLYEEKTEKAGWFKDLGGVLGPSLLALILIYLIIFSHSVSFFIDESSRKFISEGNLSYSGLESSLNKEIKDKELQNTFNEKKSDIAKTKSCDEDSLVGFWFSLSLPKDSDTTYDSKIIIIRMKNNKYGKNWDLLNPAYPSKEATNTLYDQETYPHEIMGIQKNGYKYTIKKIKPGGIFKVLFVLKKKEDKLVGLSTWKYAIDIELKNE